MSSNVASGIVEGVIGGGSIGAAGGPLGILAGGIIGGVIGGFAGNAQDQAAQDAINQAQDQKRRQQELADKQYNLNILSQDQKVQSDDADQLQTLVDAMGDSTLSLDDKLALIDGEIAKGLGTESVKLAVEARTLAMQEFDLYGEGGARDLAKRGLDSQLLTAGENIAQGQVNRDIGVSGIGATNAALGVEGVTATAQTSSAAHEANQAIQQAVRAAGYSIDALGAGGGDTAGFDLAVGLAMMGDNTYLQEFETESKRAEIALGSNMALFGNDVTSLDQADQNYRSAAGIAREGAQINFDQMQWEIDRANKQRADWTLGLVTGLANGIGKAPSYYKGGQGLKAMGQDMKWWA